MPAAETAPLLSDYLGNPLSASSPDAVDAADNFVRGFLTYQSTAARIVADADRMPDFVLGQAYAGLLCMLVEAPEAASLAAPYLARARAGRAQVTPREASVIDLLAAWAADDLQGVRHIARGHVEAWPRDLAMVKLYQYHAFNRGDFAAMLWAAEAALAAAPETPQAHGMAAFALEQLHLLDQAEAAARRALDLLPDEPWAQHALAHVMLTQGRIAEGVRFLEAARPGWVGLNSFMETHLWWHLALFYLSQGRFEEALAAYDEHVWAVAKDYSQDQVNAVSLLARLELAGVDVGDRWRDVASHLLARTGDTTQPFLTLHYLYGLERGGETAAAEALLAAISGTAEHGPADGREVWAEVALRAGRGLLAQARGEHDTAVRELRLALPRLVEIGGSHAQRDVFEQILLDSLIRSGRLTDAQQLLELRRLHDPDGVPLNRTLAEVYGRLGLPAQAERAHRRAGGG